MSKTVSMTIKLERELRDGFAAEAARRRRPASQLIREFMWAEIEGVKVPNAETIAAMEETDRGEGTPFNSVEEMFRECGV